MTQRRPALVALVALAAVAACSGDDAAPAPTVAATVAVGGLPAEIAPASSVPAPPAASVGPSFAAAALVPAATDRPWLLVGTGRADAGIPAQVAAFSSPDGSAWTPIELGVAEHSGAAAAYAAADGTVVVAGTVDDDDGRHPAVWTLAGGVLSAPDVLTDVDGAVTAAAPTADGAPMVLVASPDGPVVAVGSSDGWTVTPLPGGGNAVAIGVDAASVVVTGSSVWRSGDGGRTFEPTAAAPVLGAVLGTPDGFVAASCATGGIAVSPDGLVWTDLPSLHPRGVAPVGGGGCDTIAADDEGGVWLASVAGDPMVFRVRDQLVDRLGVPPRPAGTLFAGPPLVAAAGGIVAVAVPQPGGVATSVASSVTLTTDLELDAAMTPTMGAPLGHAAPVGVVALDDAGLVAGVATYPVVVDAPDGSYRWSTTLAASRIDDDGALVADDVAAPTGPDGSLGGIVRVGARDVSVATVADADPPVGSAPTGDVVLSTRADGSWSARQVVAGGPGRQAVRAVVGTGTAAVAVGEQIVADAAGNAPVAPLVLVTDGVTTRSLAVDAPGSTFLAACAGPGGTVVAVGRDPAGAVVLASIDVSDETVAIVPGPDGDAVTSCAGDGSSVLLAGPRSLVATADLATFAPASTVAPGQEVVAVTAGPTGFAVAGASVTGDGFVLRGADATSLEAVDVDGLGGVGDQVPTGVVWRGSQLVVLGLADGAPVGWAVPGP